MGKYWEKPGVYKKVGKKELEKLIDYYFTRGVMKEKMSEEVFDADFDYTNDIEYFYHRLINAYENIKPDEETNVYRPIKKMGPYEFFLVIKKREVKKER